MSTIVRLVTGRLIIGGALALALVGAAVAGAQQQQPTPLEQAQAQLAQAQAQLERALALAQQAQGGGQPAPSPAPIAAQPATPGMATTPGVAATPAVPAAPAGMAKTPEPFAFADFTWLNGNSRTSESPIDTKAFTGEFRVDTSYITDFNHPKDNTLVGSSESGRTTRSSCSSWGSAAISIMTT
jgi:hypothetical protein